LPTGGGPCGFRRRLALSAGLGILLWCLPVTGWAQNSFRWVTNYYAVTGADFPEIMDSINRSRPARLAPPLSGLTEWNIHWRIAMSPTEHGCRCSSFTTHTTLTNTLPFWRPPTNATYRMKNEWQRYFGNLATHEAGHSRIALAALAEVHRQVKEVKEAPDYESLRTQINQTVEHVLDRYRQMEVDYDTRTEHGARQFAAVSPAGKSP